MQSLQTVAVASNSGLTNGYLSFSTLSNDSRSWFVTMLNTVNTPSVIVVAFVAVAFPIVFRVISSPVLLVLLSPLLILLCGFAFAGSFLFLAHTADKRARNTNVLRGASRPFAFSTPAAWQAVLTRSQWSQNAPQSFPPLYPDAPFLSTAINDILIMIVRDFVLTWYKDISSSPTFPLAVSSVLHESVKRLIDQAEGIDIAALLVKRILPKVTAHIEQFRQSEVALRGAGLERKLTQSDELDLLLANKYTGKGNMKLHPAVENLSTTFTKQTEEIHLRQLVDRALPHILPSAEGHSPAFKVVVRELVVCTVLQPLMEMVADPDFWNQHVDRLAGAAIHQQKLITRVRNVLEAQSPRAHSRVATTGPVTAELITIRTDARQFESFLRSIDRCSSLLDARRLKNDVVGEIRRTRMLLANHNKEDWINGEKTEDVVAFLDRLYTAKRKVEERIIELGGDDSRDRRQSTMHDIGQKTGLTLRDILSNPSSLSYFMEFMDRHNRSLLVQFWLTVESFKNPLESVESDESSDESGSFQDTANLSATIKEDIRMINDLYFLNTPHPLLISIPQKYIDTIRQFCESDQIPSPSAERKVRRCVLLSQRQVERRLEQDFEGFQQSELWFRAVGDTDPSGYSLNSPLPSYREEQPSSPIETYGSTGSQGQIKKRRDHTTMQRTASSGSNRSIGSTAPVPATEPPLPSSIEVLMSPVSDTNSDASRPPLFDDPEDQQQREEERRMEAIKAALTDIMALDQEQTENTSQRSRTRPPGRPPGISPQNSGERTRRAIFDDEPDEVEDDIDLDHGDSNASEEPPQPFQPAGPGDLQLSYEIARLADKVANLESQDIMLDSLIKKAELTGDTQEHKLLIRSKSAMSRNLRELRFQKQQYEQQESANRLYSDRTKVSIVSSAVGEEDGKSVVRYLVEIQQLAADGSNASGWVVARRYNEFLSLHNKLRERYSLVKNLDFPGKRLVTSLSGSFLDTRKVGLEKYLQSVVAIPVACGSDELRTFLSRDSPFVASESQASKSSSNFAGSGLVRTMYRSVADSIDDMFFGPSMLDVMIQRLTRQAAELAGIVGSGVNDEDLVAQALNASIKSEPHTALLRISGDLKPIDGETSTSTFSAPICDLILAVFELNKKNNWLRRQAIVIILQQVLGGTVERKIRENVKMVLEEPRLLFFLNTFRDSLWPGGKLRPPSIPRTPEEKLRTRDEANRKLSSLIPDLAANMIGRSNARRGARRIFAVLQNRRLNQHIVYTVVDEVFAALFPAEMETSHPVA